jgi:16S rRNA (uracil1498-N3)-methyltransferase
VSAAPFGPDPRLVGSAAHVFVDDLSSPTLGAADAHHLLDVLRLRVGEVVTASDGRGAWCECALAAGGVLVAIGRVETTTAPTPRLTIGFAIPKGDRPEWIVQKLTELGVDVIVPFTSARSVVRWDAARAERNHVRLQRVAVEASMQSRRTSLPTVAAPTTFEGALAPAAVSRRTILAAPGAAPHSAALLDGVSEIAVLVGPEGGWSDGELAAVDCQVGLGATVLRTETAALAAGVLFVASRAVRVSG